MTVTAIIFGVSLVFMVLGWWPPKARPMTRAEAFPEIEVQRRRRLRSVVGCSCGDCEANRLKLWNKDINLKESA